MSNQTGLNQETPASTSGHATSMDEMKAFFAQALQQSQETMLAKMKEELSASVTASVHDAVSSSSGLSGIKRRAADIKNEGIKKQFTPMEESMLRMQAVQQPLQAFVNGEIDSISQEEAARMTDYLDEGIAIASQRLQHLEIAETQGWSVAKKMEEAQLTLHLDEESQKRLKKAKKEVKEEEKEKEAKKGKKVVKQGPRQFVRHSNFFPRGGFTGGFRRGGFHNGGAPRMGGPCYSCGRPGHVAAFCPSQGLAAVNAGRAGPALQ